MCPDRKLKWFKEHGRTTQQIKAIEKMVIKCWNDRYAPEEVAVPVEDTGRTVCASYLCVMIIDFMFHF